MTLTGAVLFAYWGVFTRLPGFLSAPIEDGGAVLTLVRSSGFLIAVQAGAYAGYLSFGWLADRYGRRPVFAAYVLAAAALTPIYGLAPVYAGRHIEAVLLVLGPVMGFAGTGYFSLFGAVLAEIYPTRIRGSGQGLTYNAGRIASALAPYLVGRAADRAGIGAALGIASGFFAAAAALV
ncbi:MAG: MFS transporter [Bryobacteraceae bacterium]